MPRVSDEHLERRHGECMDAAVRCFARKGFHETTLQDVFRESGLSAGAVYRYFKSKNDLIQAIAAEESAPITAIIESALAQDPVPGADEVAGGWPRPFRSSAARTGRPGLPVILGGGAARPGGRRHRARRVGPPAERLD